MPHNRPPLPSPAAHQRPQTWALRDVTTGKLLGVRQTLPQLFEVIRAHQAANPGARYQLAVDTQAEAARYDRDCERIAKAFATDDPGNAVREQPPELCPCCSAAPAVPRGNGCEDVCDDCLRSAADAGGACAIDHERASRARCTWSDDRGPGSER